MAKFKASSSSSGFVSVATVLILLAVIINMYPAPVAASLEAVEEVAKDQGTKDVAGVHHHEIRGRVVLQDGIISSIGRVITGVMKGVPPFKPRYNPGFKPSPRTGYNPGYKPSPRTQIGNLQDIYYNYLDVKFCSPTYCYYIPGQSCQCGRDFKTGYQPCAPNAVYYCCRGGHGVCTGCCLSGSNIPRLIFP